MLLKTKTFLTVPILIFAVLACNALAPFPEPDTPAQPEPKSDLPITENEVPRVTVEEAKAAFDRGEAVIVDVRSRSAYESSHVLGAEFITLGVFETDIESVGLNKEQWIITYCT